MAKSKRTPADALREVPPREFVQARNELAARLARNRQSTEARLVARLRRPSPVTWALNRAASGRTRDLRVLIDAADRLRRAQLGQGDPRTATEHYRTAFEPLVHGANQALREAGSSVSAALDRRIRSTLLAAVTDRGLRADLEAGRLAEEHAEPGFAVLSRGPVPAEFLRDRPKRRARTPARSAPATATRSAAESRKLAPERARAARDAARGARGLETRARRAERAAQAADQRLEAMRRDLQALEQRSAALKAAATTARNARVARVGQSPPAG